MHKTILALVFIGISGTAAAQSQIRLSDVPPGALHTPGIGPGYIFPAYDTQGLAAADSMAGISSMMPGADLPSMSQQVSVIGASEAQALLRIRAQGYGDVQNLRQDADGTWRGTAMHRGKAASVSVDAKGVVSVSQ